MRRLDRSREEGESTPEVPFKVAFERMFALARPEWRWLAVATLFLLLGTVMGLAYPLAIRWVVDGALEGGRETMDRATLAMVVIFAVQAVAVAARYFLFTVAGERIVTRLREAVYRNLVAQEIAFFDQRRTGELISRLASDATVIQNTVTVNVSMALRSVLLVTGGLLLLFYISGWLTAIMLAIVPPIALAATIVGRRISKLSRKAQDALARANEVAEETIGGIRTVRTFAREEEEVQRYGSAIWESFAIARQRVLVIAVFIGCMTLAAFGSMAAVLRIGGGQVLLGTLTIGELTSFTLYTMYVSMGISTLADLWSDFMRARGASQRVFELLNREPAMSSSEGECLPQVAGRVELNQVHFVYPSRPDATVLVGIDLVLEPGEVVALVGPSGSGKSTIAGLIPRLYDPARGEVLLDGVDVRLLDPRWLRSQIGVVAQEPMLFSTTIEENIRYGRPEASGEEIEAAARAANAHDFIAGLPDGYQTEVGERGVQLSGGQKQRVAIARAILKDPPVLILDEATSALDAESEALVRDALERLMHNRTSLVIAHRLSTVKDAHRVVVVVGGEVIEVGTHDELMEHGGVYRRLVRHQFASVA